MTHLNSFTLTELLIIIGIIGTLVLIGIPVFRNFQPTLQINGITRELATDLRYAQQLSIAEQIAHGVRFFSLEDKYQIIRYGATEEILKERLLPEGIDFQQISGFTNDEIKFNPYGAAKEAGEVTLINSQNKTKAIEVKISGFVKISQ